MDAETRRAMQTGAVLALGGVIVGVVGINLTTSCTRSTYGACLGPSNDSVIGFLLMFVGACAALLGIVYLLSLPPKTLPDAPDAVFRVEEEPLPEKALFWGRVLWIAILCAGLVVVEAIPIYYLYAATSVSLSFDIRWFLGTIAAFGLADVTFIAFMLATFDSG